MSSTVLPSFPAAPASAEVPADMPTPLDAAALAALSDHELLAGCACDQVWENFLAAQQAARLEEFRCRREAEQQVTRARDGHFALTPLQETIVEAGDLLGLTQQQVAERLRITRALQRDFPGVWELCRTGALDAYRAALVVDAAKPVLDRPEQLSLLATRIAGWLRSKISTDGDQAGLVACTSRQLRNKLTYEIRKIKPRSAEERFTAAFKGRHVRAQVDEDGMGYLGVSHCSTDVQLADYRLTLAAQALRNAGDQRTTAQLRADLLIDLAIGRVQIPADTSTLEDAADADPATPAGADPAGVVQALTAGRFARPILNITVPIQTVMGLSDHPGIASGGTPVPATLVRMLARDPESSWYRMLTDGPRMVELSTTSYRPTAPLWREVVARDQACYQPACDRPATESELDHRTPWPTGQTTATNLSPGCKRDHKAKHSHGYRLTQNTDGTTTLHTRGGFTHHTEHRDQPWLDEWPAEETFETQYTAGQIMDAIRYLRAHDRMLSAYTARRLTEEEHWLLNGAPAM